MSILKQKVRKSWKPAARWVLIEINLHMHLYDTQLNDNHKINYTVTRISKPCVF